MLVASWNINSLRHRLKLLRRFVRKYAPEVVCLQETKVPDELYRISPVINWGTLFLMAATVYYFIISVPLAIGMLPFVVGVAYVHVWLEASPYSPVMASAGFLTAGVLGLLLGQRRNRPFVRLVQDLQMMMIGPAWLLSVLYRRMGIPI